MKNLYGLIGFPLSHSFSKKYFSEKFEKEGIKDAVYELFPLENVADIEELINEKPELRGLNVTIPHKQTVMPFLDQIDPFAQRIGAVNVIKIVGNQKIGSNSDFFGFSESLKNFVPTQNLKALILGTGGASKAVKVALEELNIPFLFVSRQADSQKNILAYQDLDKSLMTDYQLVINTTPLGMYPNVDQMPDLRIKYFTEKHFVMDLVYNPSETLLMKTAQKQGAKAINGLEMLHLQAEKAWEIWNKS
ncbi:MAG: shikimate dehydrogenase [Bacteroidetes bacterium]|nr:MAG: shikimate dehydrogenase [Bacteroidota bacterium]